MDLVEELPHTSGITNIKHLSTVITFDLYLINMFCSHWRRIFFLPLGFTTVYWLTFAKITDHKNKSGNEESCQIP